MRRSAARMKLGAWSLPMCVVGTSSKHGATRKASWPIISPRLWHWQEREKLAACGFAGLCLSPDPLRAVLRSAARVAAAHVLSSYGLALPHSQSPALSAAQCPLPALAKASAQLRVVGATTTAQRARARWVRASRQAVTAFFHSSRIRTRSRVLAVSEHPSVRLSRFGRKTREQLVFRSFAHRLSETSEIKALPFLLLSLAKGKQSHLS